MFFALVVLITGAVIFVRLVWIQIVEADELQKKATRQYRARVVLESHRGTIYDRTGRPLTDNLCDYVRVGVNPYRVTDPTRLASDLARVTGRPINHFLKQLRRHNRYVVLARKITPSEFQQLKKLGWNLSYTPESHRTYPHERIAGQLTGFTDIDNRGISGLELTFDELLCGKPGWRVVQLDVEGRPHLDKGFPSKPLQNGGDLVLTVELAIQSILEEELAPAISYYKGKSAAGLVIDPRNGEVIAMASLPLFDPNRPEVLPTARQKNLPITEMFEPGSTFKIIPAALLLESGVVQPETEVDCGNGYVTIFGKTIHDIKDYGCLTFKEVIVRSSNVGMIEVTSGIDSEKFYRMVSDFGFLGRTGIELSGEVMGSLLEPENWSGLTRPNLVIGQGVAVTMLQLAMAYAAVANDGKLMKPSLVRVVRDPDGRIERERPLVVRRVISARTAETLTDFLIEAVENGTGRRARIPGMKIAGKTGTAQIVNRKEGGYYSDRFIASFVGYFPAEDPRYIVLVVINDPNGPLGEHTGGSVAAPIFCKVARRILGLKPELWPLAQAEVAQNDEERVEVPDLSFCTVSQVKRNLHDVGLRMKFYGRGSVVYDQIPAGGARVSPGDLVQLTLGPSDLSKGATVIMPLLTGLSLRDAVKKVTEKGLAVQIKGTGRVVRQLPLSGASVPVGEVCSIVAKG